MPRRYKLALFTFVAVFTGIMSVGVWGGRYLLAYVEEQYLLIQSDSNRQRAQGAARMMEQYLNSGAAPEDAIRRFQSAIEGTSSLKAYLCLVDRDGRLLSHPDPAMIGQNKSSLRLTSGHHGRAVPWGQALRPGQRVAGRLHMGEGVPDEIVCSVPIPGTTWFASAHANSSFIASELDKLATRLTVSSVALGMMMALVASLMARWVGRRYERHIERANERLEHEVEARTAELRKALEDLRIAHDRLIRGEKMNLLGELMSGIAHEIRAPLSSILSGIHVLKRDVNVPGARATMDLLGISVERLSSIVKNMLSFAKNAPPSRHTVDLNNICLSAVDLIASDLQRDGVELREALSIDLPQMELDTQQIQQVVLNLLHNAHQALNGYEGERWIELSTSADPMAVHIDVKDSGPGVPVASREAVFRPFFTTKREGTGLGLSLCRRFLEAHGAALDLVPSVRGAHFRVTLPRSACETMAAVAE